MEGDEQLIMICDCDLDAVPGAIWPIASDGDDSHPWVERCDNCKRFADDVAAAEAVAAKVGRPVRWANVHGRPTSAQPYVEREENP
jgi:hypothetical protein